jgi:hypothetical protein
MAKALVGHLQYHDPRAPARLAAENARLRARVRELEAVALRLSRENDLLVAAAHESLTTESDLQPA